MSLVWLFLLYVKVQDFNHQLYVPTDLLTESLPKKTSILPEEVRQKLIGAKSSDIEAWHVAHLHQKLELLTPG